MSSQLCKEIYLQNINSLEVGWNPGPPRTWERLACYPVREIIPKRLVSLGVRWGYSPRNSYSFSRPIYKWYTICFGGTKRVLNCRIMMNYVTSCFMRFDPAISLRTRLVPDLYRYPKPLFLWIFGIFARISLTLHHLGLTFFWLIQSTGLIYILNGSDAFPIETLPFLGSTFVRFAEIPSPQVSWDPTKNCVCFCPFFS